MRENRLVGLAGGTTGVTLAFMLVTGCDSTSPISEQAFHFAGEVLEEGQPPSPPLLVEVQAWPSVAAPGVDTTSTVTDLSGRYNVNLGPFPSGRVDSVRARVNQADCFSQVRTQVLIREWATTRRDTIALPKLTLSYHLLPGQLEIGAAVCGAVLVPLSTESIGDYIRLALWVDQIADSVRGRWYLAHQATTASEYGDFSGSLQLDTLRLQLRSTPPTLCNGFELDIPVGGDNGSTMGAANLRSEGTCFVPDTVVRFFQGTSLPEPSLKATPITRQLRPLLDRQ